MTLQPPVALAILNSQISNFFEIETYIIERLEKDFKTIKTNLSDLKPTQYVLSV